MKNSIKTSVLIMCTMVFVIISCENPKEREPKEPVKFEAPSQIISLKQGLIMKKEYERTFAPLIARGKSNANQNGEPYQPTEFVFIELDSLKKYVQFLEQVEKMNKKKISGIRIYYAAYPNEDRYKNPGRETMFFAPTMAVESKEMLTDAQKQYPNLRNIPFYIQPKNASRKYVGEYVPIDGLLFKGDIRQAKNESKTKNKIMQASLVQEETNSGLEPTSLLLNELNQTPPPAK